MSRTIRAIWTAWLWWVCMSRAKPASGLVSGRSVWPRPVGTRVRLRRAARCCDDGSGEDGVRAPGVGGGASGVALTGDGGAHAPGPDMPVAGPDPSVPPVHAAPGSGVCGPCR